MNLIKWVRKVFRDFKSNDPTETTELILKTHEYKWFVFYSLNEETFEFDNVQEIELYVNKSMFAEGYFHTVNKA